MTEALVGFAVMLTLSLLRMPIAFSMALVGAVGFAWLNSPAAALSMIGTVTYETGMSYALSVVPLFVLMGNFVTRAGMSEELYDASYAFLGHRRGGLAMATIVACGGFGAICGSSLATTATMAKVAMPSMRRFGYSDALAAGSIAAGGTLGILIPPSVIMVIYGFLTETSIGALFAAGVLPGIVAIGCYIAAVAVTTHVNPKAGPPGERYDFRLRMRALGRIWQVLLLFTMVMGGIYGGVFTPTEAAGVGATGGFAFLLFRRGFDSRMLIDILRDSAETTAMVFTVLIGALIFSNFISVTGMSGALKDWITGLNVAPIVVIFGIVAIYVILGCVLESISMILLTVPIFYPLVVHLGYDLIWFGIVVVVVTEISLITPPIGMNVFVLRAVLADVPTSTIFRGVAPFIYADIIRIAILIFLPAISLFLPRILGL